MAPVQWLPALSRIGSFGLPVPTSSCSDVERFPLRLRVKAQRTLGASLLRHVVVAREGRPWRRNRTD